MLKNNPFFIPKTSSRWFGSCAHSGDKYESFSNIKYAVRAFFIMCRVYFCTHQDISIDSFLKGLGICNKERFEKCHLYVPHYFMDNFFGEFGVVGPVSLLQTKDDFFVFCNAVAFVLSHVHIDNEILEYVWKYYHIENDKFPYYIPFSAGEAEHLNEANEVSGVIPPTKSEKLH